jgi:hypothetical protein
LDEESGVLVTEVGSVLPGEVGLDFSVGLISDGLEPPDTAVRIEYDSVPGVELLIRPAIGIIRERRPIEAADTVEIRTVRVLARLQPARVENAIASRMHS